MEEIAYMPEWEIGCRVRTPYGLGRVAPGERDDGAGDSIVPVLIDGDPVPHELPCRNVVDISGAPGVWEPR